MPWLTHAVTPDQTSGPKALTALILMRSTFHIAPVYSGLRSPGSQGLKWLTTTSSSRLTSLRTETVFTTTLTENVEKAYKQGWFSISAPNWTPFFFSFFGGCLISEQRWQTRCHPEHRGPTLHFLIPANCLGDAASASAPATHEGDLHFTAPTLWAFGAQTGSLKSISKFHW